MPGAKSTRGSQLGRAITFPRDVVIDTREQRPFRFLGLRADAADGNAPLFINTIQNTLKAGDYSLVGYEDLIAVERKSMADLFGTLGRGRNRFVRELERLSTFQFAAVVVEGDWTEVVTNPPPRSQLRPRTVVRSVIAWQQRFPTVHWWFAPDRDFAEAVCFRILQRFWLDRQGKSE